MLEKRCAIDAAFQAGSKNAEQCGAQLRVARCGACSKGSMSPRESRARSQDLVLLPESQRNPFKVE